MKNLFIIRKDTPNNERDSLITKCTNKGEVLTVAESEASYLVEITKIKDFTSLSTVWGEPIIQKYEIGDQVTFKGKKCTIIDIEYEYTKKGWEIKYSVSDGSTSWTGLDEDELESVEV